MSSSLLVWLTEWLTNSHFPLVLRPVRRFIHPLFSFVPFFVCSFFHLLVPALFHSVSSYFICFSFFLLIFQFFFSFFHSLFHSFVPPLIRWFIRQLLVISFVGFFGCSLFLSFVSLFARVFVRLLAYLFFWKSVLFILTMLKNCWLTY